MSTPSKDAAAGSVGRQVATLLTGTTMVQALGLLVSPIVARIYGPQALGQVAAAAVVASMAATVAPLALDGAIVLVHSDEEASELAGFVVSSAVLVGVLSTVVVWVASQAFAGWQVTKFVEVSPVFWSGFVGGIALLTCYVQAVTSLAIRHQQFDLVSMSRVVQSVTTQCLTLALGFAGLGAKGAAGAVLVGQAAGAAMLLRARSRDQRAIVLRAPSFARTKALILANKRYPLYTYPHALLDSLRENALVAAMSAAGGEIGLGYWALVARTVRGPASMLGSAFSQVFTARVAERAREGQPLEPIMRWVVVRLGAASAFGLVTLVLGGPLLFGLVFGPQWREAGNVARYIVPWIAVNLVASPFAYLAYLLKINRPYLVWAIAYDLALIAACTVAPLYFSFLGVVASISSVGAVLLSAILIWQYRMGRSFDQKTATIGAEPSRGLT